MIRASRYAGTPQYLADLMSWGAIGARTTESQVHRELCCLTEQDAERGDTGIPFDQGGDRTCAGEGGLIKLPDWHRHRAIMTVNKQAGTDAVLAFGIACKMDFPHPVQGIFIGLD